MDNTSIKFKKIFALLLLAMGLIVANAAEAVEANGPREYLANKGLSVSDNFSTKVYDPNLIAKSNDVPTIYNGLKKNGTVRIILRYKIKSGLSKLNAQNNDIKQYKQKKTLIEKKILLTNFGTNEPKKTTRSEPSFASF